MDSQYHVLLIVLFCCVVFYYQTWRPYRYVMDENPCEMSYSLSLANRRKEIKLKTKTPTDFKFYKYGSFGVNNAFESDTEVHPVLFIPGHLGDADQIRSFSSAIDHNRNGPFDYYSIDFTNKWSSSSGAHGNNIMAQAIYVNDALKFIKRNYKNVKTKDNLPPKVTIIAHSAGGMVARLAVLLSNHPSRYSSSISPVEAGTELSPDDACLVSTIVLLSAPTVRPAYSVDISLDNLYKQINSAWLSSFFYASPQCAAKPTSPGDKHLRVEWNCPKCVSSIKLISISGGLVDAMVHPQLTHLGVITPQPSKKKILDKLKGDNEYQPGDSLITLLFKPQDLIVYAVKYVGYGLFNGLYYSVTYIFSLVNDTSASSDASNIFNESMSSMTNVTCDGNGISDEFNITTGVCHTVNTSYVNEAPVLSEDDEAIQQWNAEMHPYKEPEYVSILTNQIVEDNGVGFPVDHHAMMWCHQLLSRSHTAILNILHGVYDDVPAALRMLKLFNIKMALPEPVSKVDNITNRSTVLNYMYSPIPSLEGYHIRNLTFYTQWREGLIKDEEYLILKLVKYLKGVKIDAKTVAMDDVRPTEPLTMMEMIYAASYLLGITYLTRHCLSCVVMCYVSIALLVFTVPIFRNICGVNVYNAITNALKCKEAFADNTHILRMLSVNAQTQLDIILPKILENKSSKMFLYGLSIVFIGRYGWDAYNILSMSNDDIHGSIMIVRLLVLEFQNLFKYVVSYGLALGIYCILTYAFFAVRFCTSLFVCTPLYICLVVFPEYLFMNTLGRVSFVRKMMGFPVAEQEIVGNGNMDSDEVEKIRQKRREKAANKMKPTLENANKNTEKWSSFGMLFARLLTTLILLIVLSTRIVRGDNTTPTPMEILGLKQYCVCLLSLYGYIALLEHFVILWLFSNGNSYITKKKSKLISIVPYRITSHEIQWLCIYIIVLCLLLPNALNNAELLLLRMPVNVHGMDYSLTLSNITQIFQYALSFMVDDNRVYKSMLLFPIGNASIRDGFHIYIQGSERVYELLSMALINVHLVYMIMQPIIQDKCVTDISSTRDDVSKYPLNWCVTLFGRTHPFYDKHLKMEQGDDDYLSSVPLNSGNNQVCCHEDGGKYAIFEELHIDKGRTDIGFNKVNKNSQHMGERNVTFYPTRCFKVIYCACYKDKSLTNGIADYCEYCRCFKCGGKNLPKEFRNQHHDQLKEELMNSLFKFLNIELLMVASIYLLFFWNVYIYQTSRDSLHKYAQVVTLHCSLFVAYFIYKRIINYNK